MQRLGELRVNWNDFGTFLANAQRTGPNARRPPDVHRPPDAQRLCIFTLAETG